MGGGRWHPSGISRNRMRLESGFVEVLTELYAVAIYKIVSSGGEGGGEVTKK
jgi:hypothetical protein